MGRLSFGSALNRNFGGVKMRRDGLPQNGHWCGSLDSDIGRSTS
jgi:hypothetical protein